MQKIADGKGPGPPELFRKRSTPFGRSVDFCEIQVLNQAMKKSAPLLLTCILTLLLLNACNKGSDVTPQSTQSEFENNYLNRNYTIHLATDNGTDLTAQYNGFVFRLVKGNPQDGIMTASKNGNTWTGSWSTNADYTQLGITLPGSVPEFLFLVRNWKFTHKGIPILELVPLNGPDPKVLHLQRQ